jgi:hypothetical protein
MGCQRKGSPYGLLAGRRESRLMMPVPRTMGRSGSTRPASTDSDTRRSKRRHSGLARRSSRFWRPRSRRDELPWTLDRHHGSLVRALRCRGSGRSRFRRDLVGDEVYALTPLNRRRSGRPVCRVPTTTLAPRPPALSHVESGAVQLSAPSAWQGLFVHGGLEPGERVLAHSACRDQPSQGMAHSASLSRVQMFMLTTTATISSIAASSK